MDDLGSRSIIMTRLYCNYKLRNWTVRRSNGARFSALVQTIPGALSASYTYCTMGTGSFPKVKRPGYGVNHPLPTSAEVKERVELYRCFTF